MSSTGTTLADFGGGEEVEEARHVTEGDEVGELIDLSEYQFPDADGVAEVSVTQVDYTVEGYGDEEYPVLHVFGRTADEEREHIRIFDFQPYFYTPVDELDHERPDQDRELREADFEDDRLMEERIAGVETKGQRDPTLDEPEADEVVVYQSIRGDDLVKVFGQTPRDVGQLRDRFDHYEADILFPNRLLIDKDITAGIRVPDQRAEDGSIKVHHEQIEPIDLSVDPRVHTFDIEVDDRSGFPEDGEEKIICMTSHDSYRGEYVAWLYDAPDAEVPAPEELTFEFLDGERDIDLRVFDTETAMHEDYLDYLDETDPDVLTGWNFDDFDAPYYVARLAELGLESDRLSRVDEVWDSGWGGPNIKGRVVFDLLYAYERRQYSELDSYRLDAVAEQELGVGKERYAGDIGDLWEQDPTRLLEYNLRDVELCVEIDRRVDLISFWSEVATFVGCKLEDATTPGDAVDLYILHKVHGDYALPSKGTVASEDYEGGAVFDPVSGIRENVTVLDLKCFSSDTDILTPDGVQNIRELDEGDPVYTLNPKTFECEIKPVAETHTYENRFGELHHLSGNTHDLKLTENHRLLYSKERGWDEQTPEDFEFDAYRDIPENERFAFPQHEPMNGRRPDRFSLVEEIPEGNVVIYTDDDLRVFRNQMPESLLDELNLVHGSSQTLGLQQSVGKYLVSVETYLSHRAQIDEHADDLLLKYGTGHSEIPLSFSMDDWLRLLGWYVTEGSVDRSAARFTIHQQDTKNRKQIRALLDRLGIDYNADERGMNVSNEILTEWLAEHCGEGYANKQLPEWVFELDGTLLSDLLDTLVRGDGSVADSGLQKFWTKSPQLRDAVADIAVRCGHKPTVSEQSDGTYYLSIGKRGSFNKGTNATVENHDGQVHCITAEDNHVVLAGRNGNFQWVGQSLYPMCMVTTNASPETKVDLDEYDGETYRAPNGTHFRKEPDGIIREMVDELLTERENKKAARDEHDPDEPEYERYDSQQAAVKVIMNSLYGVLGWDRFRLYDKEMGAAVTATGRRVIEFTEQSANEIGHEVAYGDTDSIMLELGQEYPTEQAVDTSFEIEEHINASYDEFARTELNAESHRFQIEFEKLYRRFFQAGTKKRYAGNIIWKEGKSVDDIDITGFEYKRSDIAPVTKEVQKRVLDMIVTEGDVAGVKEYVHDTIEAFQTGERPLDDIGIPGGIGKKLGSYDTDTAQVRGAKYANLLLGTNFQRGSKPKRLYLEKVHPDFWTYAEEELGLDPQRDPLYGEFKRDPDVICFEYADEVPEEFEVDWDKMLEKTLRGPIERVLEALDVSWEEVRDGQEQTGLGSFM